MLRKDRVEWRTIRHDDETDADRGGSGDEARGFFMYKRGDLQTRAACGSFKKTGWQETWVF